jgi:acylglycerol lipase
MAAVDINLHSTAACFEIEATQADAGGSVKNYKLQARSWGRESDCQCGVLLVHGLGAHSGWFEALARRLKVRNLFVLSYDQVGFGKRRQEKFTSGKQWFDDLTVAFNYLKKQIGDKPIFIVGNSMGALIAYLAAAQVSPAGIVMMSPGFEGYPGTFTLKYRLKTIFKALTKPDEECDVAYGLDIVTEVESVRAWAENDPDRRFAVPGRMLLELLSLTQGLRFKKMILNCPVLMILAGRDKIVDNKTNNQVFKRLIAPSKQLKVFPDSFHDLPMNPAVEDVAEEIANWIQVTVPGKVAAD